MTIVRFTQETLWILITICSLIYTGNIMDPDHYCLIYTGNIMDPDHYSLIYTGNIMDPDHYRLIYTGNIMDPDHYSFYDAKLRDIVTSWLHL